MPSTDINIKLVGFEDSPGNVGLRRISALMKPKYKNTVTYFYNTTTRSPKSNGDIHINPEFIDELQEADIIGFSGVSIFANYIKKAISLVRSQNKKALIVWGASHATVYPEDAVQHADAVCIGEGSKSFPELIEKYVKGEPIDDCKGFWFNRSGQIIRNCAPPLMSNEELASMPFQDYGFDLKYVTYNKIVPMTKEVYIAQFGSKYSTIWTLGCPFRCTFCGNDAYIKNDRGNAIIRHSSPEYVVNEILYVLKSHDYITYIEFNDDQNLFLDKEIIAEFAELYKKNIGLPLFLKGLYPTYINREKLSLLVAGGVRKVRMGIQTGSTKGLEFYHRKTPLQTIIDSSKVLSSFVPKIIPPFYDIILDNPVETEEDKDETLSLLYNLGRPYFVYIYSLRSIPGTQLSEFIDKNPELGILPIDHPYRKVSDTRMELMVCLLSLFRPPRFLYNLFLRISKNRLINKPVLSVVRLLYLAKRLYYEVISGNLQPLAMMFPRLALTVYKMRRKRLIVTSHQPAKC